VTGRNTMAAFATADAHSLAALGVGASVYKTCGRRILHTVQQTYQYLKRSKGQNIPEVSRTRMSVLMSKRAERGGSLHPPCGDCHGWPERRAHGSRASARVKLYHPKKSVLTMRVSPSVTTMNQPTSSTISFPMGTAQTEAAGHTGGHGFINSPIESRSAGALFCITAA